MQFLDFVLIRKKCCDKIVSFVIKLKGFMLSLTNSVFLGNACFILKICDLYPPVYIAVSSQKK